MCLNLNQLSLWFIDSFKLLDDCSFEWENTIWDAAVQLKKKKMINLYWNYSLLKHVKFKLKILTIEHTGIVDIRPLKLLIK